MGKHRGRPAIETPVDPRGWGGLSDAEKVDSIVKAAEFDTYDNELKKGNTPPAPTVKRKR